MLLTDKLFPCHTNECIIVINCIKSKLINTKRIRHTGINKAWKRQHRHSCMIPDWWSFLIIDIARCSQLWSHYQNFFVRNKRAVALLLEDYGVSTCSDAPNDGSFGYHESLVVLDTDYSSKMSRRIRCNCCS